MCRIDVSRSAILVPMVGFEPTRLASPPPQDGVSTNSTTSARSCRISLFAFGLLRYVELFGKVGFDRS